MPDPQPPEKTSGTESAAARSFLARLDDAAAGELVSLGWGTGIFDRHRPMVWDANYVRVEPDAGLSAEMIADGVEPLFVERGLDHRAVLLIDQSALEDRETGFDGLGWESDREVVMALRDAPAPPRHRVEEISPDAFRGARRVVELAELPGDRGSEAVPAFVDQTISRDDAIASFASVRYLGVVDGGEVVAFCVLYSRDGIGQIELVTTIHEHRGRGYGRAIVLAASAASIERGNRLTFLVALADDWPRKLYSRLGFAEIGGQTRIRRPPVDADPS
jgi:ribosomal protein S18 acetylase RimI-like enzyme